MSNLITRRKVLAMCGGLVCTTLPNIGFAMQSPLESKRKYVSNSGNSFITLKTEFNGNYKIGSSIQVRDMGFKLGIESESILGEDFNLESYNHHLTQDISMLLYSSKKNETRKSKLLGNVFQSETTDTITNSQEVRTFDFNKDLKDTSQYFTPVPPIPLLIDLQSFSALLPEIISKYDLNGKTIILTNGEKILPTDISITPHKKSQLVKTIVRRIHGEEIKRDERYDGLFVIENGIVKKFTKNTPLETVEFSLVK